MRYVKGRLILANDKQWVFIYKYDHPRAHSTLHATKHVLLTPVDEEVVRFHAEDLKASHNVDYTGEDMRAELTEMWSTPEGGWSSLYPSEAFLPVAQKQTFAKLIYQEDEDTDQEAAH